jgi:hypothetical protein
LRELIVVCGESPRARAEAPDNDDGELPHGDAVQKAHAGEDELTSRVETFGET